ncbi:MAG: isoleucine--tRNA ligase, partial [Clostridia bacterium]|nr:isoleucine--tRNA ligase [Clostridia bacterium]
ESVHLCSYPVCDESFIDPELERDMGDVYRIVVLGRAARAQENIKNRQPLSRLFVQGVEALPEMYNEIIEGELNVKAVEYVSDASAFITYRVKPQLKLLGPRYGKLLPKINNYLQNTEGVGNACVAAHAAGKPFEIEGQVISLMPEDVLVDTVKREGFSSVSEKELTVVLETTLTEELIEEGYVRELVSKVQTMRKEADFLVTDHIRIFVSGNEKIEALAEKTAASVMGDTLADELVLGPAPEGAYAKEWDINGENVSLAVIRV